MALLIFPPDNMAPQLTELIDPQLRKSVANRVNEAILSSQGARKGSQLRTLIRVRAWSEKLARESKKLDIPEGALSFGLDDQPDSVTERASAANRSEAGGTSLSQTEADGDTTMRG
jgi:glucose-induced degradation protein 8